MKALLVTCMLAAAPFVWAADKSAPPAPAANAVTGEVLEVQNVESYTYLRLKTAQGETWAAVPTAAVKKGAKVTIENANVMKNFESKTLKKTFPTVVFGTLAGAPGSVAGAPAGAGGPHAGVAKATEAAADVHVPKAAGPNARTVAEIMTKPAELKDKPVLVRGKVVKYSPAIMGKNWIHLRDGTGSAAAGTNDVLVTTTEQAKIGDIVTAKGVLRTDRDFGSGYSYKAVVEEATLQR
jgi:hypothetical protein